MTEGERQALEQSPYDVEELKKEIRDLRSRIEKPGNELRPGPGVQILGNLITATAEKTREVASSGLGETVVITAIKNGAVIPLTVAGRQGIPIGPYA